jgi:PleD family two-component response regulator
VLEASIDDLALPASTFNAARHSGGHPVSLRARAVGQRVVDDEPQILRALRVVLRDAGFEAVPASTAQEALDLAALHRRTPPSSTCSCPTATASR